MVSALLRAGADPAIRASCTAACDSESVGCTIEGVTKYLTNVLRPAYAVWVLRQVVAMRRAGELALAAPAMGTDAIPCLHCAVPMTQPLKWEKCGHLLCEPCFWARHRVRQAFKEHKIGPGGDCWHLLQNHVLF